MSDSLKWSILGRLYRGSLVVGLTNKEEIRTGLGPFLWAPGRFRKYIMNRCNVYTVLMQVP